MNLPRLRHLCLGLPGATEQIQWGADLVFKVGGKMFCVVCTEIAPVVVSLKCDDETFAELCERGGVIPAPYLARAKWVALERWSALEDREFAPLIEQAHRLVRQKLPKKTQLAIAAATPRVTPSAPMIPPDLEADARLALRSALSESDTTDSFRLIHGASDGWPGWYVDRLGSYLLSQSERTLTPAQRERLEALMTSGAYHKLLMRHARQTRAADAAPQRVLGDAAPDRFEIRENNVRFEVSLCEGYSTGLFLDQRDNRRRLLTGHVAADFALFDVVRTPRPPVPHVLNAFAYTCGFSVCGALAGAHTTSLDLSKKHLEWGRRNFALNGLDPAAHDFIYGDAFDWLRRLAKKGRAFDVVVLDPPTFSQSKTHGVFRAEKDYGTLVAAALPLVKPQGVLFVSTNTAGWARASFLSSVEGAVRAARRGILQRHYAPPPPDFSPSPAEPAYLKTVWLRIE